jgi:aspartyl-tRNA(Asn)/glutamyl-tRNA(Gln) amidotransferase subunit A
MMAAHRTQGNAARMSSPLALTTADLARAYRGGKLSPVAVTEALLDHAAAVQESLNCFALLDPAGARDQAEASAARHAAGAALSVLDGVPVAIKDNVQVRGQARRHGSLMFRHAAPETDDAPLVARLREAGAILWARTTMPDMGWKALCDSPLYGLTGNPFDATLSPGGSSGGSAAAVAANCGPLASGGDGGGSVRVPAAWCGLFGIKTTHGRVPWLHDAGTGTLVAHGPLAKSVLCSATYLSVVCRPDPRDAVTQGLAVPDFVAACGAGVRGLRVALSRTLNFADAGRDAACLDEAARVLRDAGATITEAEPPLWNAEPTFRTIWDCAHAATLAEIPPELLVHADPGMVACARRGWRTDAATDRAAQAEAARLMRALMAFMADFDLMLCPMMPVAPIQGGAGLDTPDAERFPNWWDWTPFTWPFNLTRSPAASVPWGVAEDGLPRAVQLVAPHFREDLLYRAAAVLEAAMQRPVPPDFAV